LATTASPAGGPQEPAISCQPYGLGRVVVIEGSGMWRWAFLPPQGQEQDVIYRTLWPSLLRWLAFGEGLLPGQKVALRADKLNFTTVEKATASLRVREGSAGPPSVELLADNGTKGTSFLPAALKDEPDMFRVVFGKLSAGGYRARVASSAPAQTAAETVFVVTPPIDEQLDLKARPDLMARIAQDSGGAVLNEASGDEITARFREHQSVTRPINVRRTTAWDCWWVMLAVLALWGTTWGFRRAGGLI
jgi:hypothetical protein